MVGLSGSDLDLTRFVRIVRPGWSSSSLAWPANQPNIGAVRRHLLVPWGPVSMPGSPKFRIQRIQVRRRWLACERKEKLVRLSTVTSTELCYRITQQITPAGSGEWGHLMLHAKSVPVPPMPRSHHATNQERVRGRAVRTSARTHAACPALRRPVAGRPIATSRGVVAERSRRRRSMRAQPYPPDAVYLL